MSLVIPKRGEVYTMDEVYTKLKLRDSPFFMFYPDDEAETSVPIQDGDGQPYPEEVLQTRWKFVRETEEWISIFVAVDEEQIRQFVESYVDGGDTLWRIKQTKG